MYAVDLKVQQENRKKAKEKKVNSGACVLVVQREIKEIEYDW